jgi:ankyrin repeat protein
LLYVDARLAMLVSVEGCSTGKVDVDLKDSKYGKTPLSWAAENGHETVVKLLEKAQHSLRLKLSDIFTPKE